MEEFPALDFISETNWAAREAVGEHSAYVARIAEDINKMPSTEFLPCAERLAKAIYDRVYNYDRVITETGAQCLLLDFMALYEMIAPRGDQKTQAELADVFRPVCNFLKVLIMPQESLVEAFKTFFPNGTEADFHRVLNLRGLKPRN